MYINVFEFVPNNDRPRNDCYNCLGCSHLIAVNEDSSHNTYNECDIDKKEINKYTKKKQ